VVFDDGWKMKKKYFSGIGVMMFRELVEELIQKERL